MITTVKCHQPQRRLHGICRVFVTGIFFFSVLNISAQRLLIREVHDTSPSFPEYKYIFPVVVIPGHTGIARKINKDLQQDFLSIEPGDTITSIFEKVRVTREMTIPRLSDISYTVHANTKKYLSLSISAEGCGAYCEHFTQNYSYDLATGKRIQPDTIFSRAGQRTFSDSVTYQLQQMLQNKIQETQQVLTQKDQQLTVEETSYYQDMLSLYQECKENRTFVGIDMMQFYLTGTHIHIVIDRCSAHFNRNLDELGEFSFSYPIKQWKKHLSPYGRQLFR